MRVSAFIAAVLVAASVKYLLFPTVHSTDLDVHRHWKALTHSLPLKNWYTDESSQWTLDYPPLFAYFEYFLACIANTINPAFVDLSDRSYPSESLRLYMRATVLATDLLFAPALYSFITATAEFYQTPLTLLPALLMLFSPALFLVDNIHFQYNALPISLFLFTLTFLLRRQQVLAATTFTLALNLKQTLLPLAPAVAIQLWRNAAQQSSVHTSHPLRTLFSLFLPTVAVSYTMLVIWFPFYKTGGRELIQQIASRLFPFHRGLLHAYWAPNIWAPYAALDLTLARLGFAPHASEVSTTSGRIGLQQPFRILPNPTPAICTALMVVTATPALLRCSRRVPIIIVLALAAFLFGWHVHEKAIMFPLLALAGWAGCRQDENIMDAFLWLSLGGQYGLFPLVTKSSDSMFKIAHFMAYHLFAIPALLEKRWCQRRVQNYLLIGYAVGTLLVEMYAGVGGGHMQIFGDSMPFLPLMLVSLYSFVGVFVAFCKLLLVK